MPISLPGRHLPNFPYYWSSRCSHGPPEKYTRWEWMQCINCITQKSLPGASTLRQWQPGKWAFPASGAVVLTSFSCAGPVRQSALAVEAPTPWRGPLPARPFGIQPEKTVKERTSLHAFVTTHDPRPGTGGPAPRCPPGLRSFRGLRAGVLSSSAPRGVTLRPVRVFNRGTDAPCDGQPKVTRPCGSVGFRLSLRSALGTPWRPRR